MKDKIALVLDVDGVLFDDDCKSDAKTLWIDQQRGQTWVENLGQMINTARRQNVEICLFVLSAKGSFCVVMQEIFLQFRPFLQVWNKLDQSFMPYSLPEMNKLNQYSLPVDLNSTLHITTFPKSHSSNFPLYKDLLYPIILTPYKSMERFKEAIKEKLFLGTEPVQADRFEQYQTEYYGRRKTAKLQEISEHLNIFPEQIIMVDDSDFIINKAKAEGFRTVHATREVLPDIFTAIRLQLNEAFEQLKLKQIKTPYPPTYSIPRLSPSKVAALAIRYVNKQSPVFFGCNTNEADIDTTEPSLTDNILGMI
ncbi:MAG: hypothetical protein K0U37_05475 [Gammaproteobacteria bacterium]|nr:hypothetical protein [Gammaproteobacteria bacterium]